MKEMLKVLIVDDETDIELLFRQKFRREVRDGLIDLHFAFSGQKALEYLEQRIHADIVMILSDINMPGMSGLELLRNAKQKYPHITFYIITAYGDEDNQLKAIEYGSEYFLNKPIDFEDLKKKMFQSHE